MKTLNQTIKKVNLNQRINHSEALVLLLDADLLLLGDLANKKRAIHCPSPAVTFVIDRNINYTNICSSGCRFCAFYRNKTDEDAYIISKDALHKKIKETLDLNGTQLLLQGGMNPSLDISYYIDLLKEIKNNFPIHIHGFSPPEIDFIAKTSSLSLKETIIKLMNAGLDSIPGGGAEILVDEIREKISPGKCNTQTWLEVMRTAHTLGLKSTATMMFGHVEKPQHIIEHLIKIRQLQDQTNGFTAFIPWTFQPDNTALSVKKTTAADYLRVLSLSRIVLDNITNIQASWVTQGEKIAQVALSFGANDLGSTMIEENVVKAAGVNFRLPENEMIRLIEDAGYAPVQRDCFYNIVENETS